MEFELEKQIKCPVCEDGIAFLVENPSKNIAYYKCDRCGQEIGINGCYTIL